MPFRSPTIMPLPLQVFIVTFVLGVLLRSRGILTKRHTEQLATFVFSVSLPATILVSLDSVSLTSTAWKFPLAACLITLPMVVCSWWLARLLSLPSETQGGFVLATSSINSVYFAFPVILATFGEQGLTFAVLFDLGQTTLTLTVLYGLAVRHSTQTTTHRATTIRLLSSPPLWALVCILAIKLSGQHLPLWFIDLLTPIHVTTTPLASLVLGLSISFSTIRRTARLATLGVATRVGGGLLLGLTTVWVLGLTGVERAVVLLIAAMPSAVSALIIAAEAQLDEELVASIVALSISLGVLILPWLPRVAAILLG
ncbi:MAG: AEC family transporter [Nitrospira sp.]|nr:AEC family transporter [Nitrospira sp.]